MMHTPLNPLDNHNEDIKLPTRKEKESYLKKYAKKVGLNDRGCYLAIGLAIIAFFFLVIYKNNSNNLNNILWSRNEDQQYSYNCLSCISFHVWTRGGVH